MSYLRMLRQRGYWEKAGEESSGGGSIGDTGSGTQGSGEGNKEDTNNGGTAGDGKSGTQQGSTLSDKEAELLREVMDKKTKLRTAEEELKKTSERLKQFDGLDPEQIKKLIAEAKDRETKELEAKGQWDKLRAQMAEEHTKSLQPVLDENGNLKNTLTAAQQKIADLTVGSSFGQSKFVQERVALPVGKLRALYGSHFEYDGEKVVGYDKPAGVAGRVQLVDAKGDPLPFDGALEKLLNADPDRDALLKATMKTGAASGTETRAGRTSSAPNQPASGREKIAMALRDGAKK